MKIHDLTLEERIKLVEDIWDSIAAEQEALPLTSEQKSPRDHRVGATIIAHSGSATCPLPSGRGSDFPVQRELDRRLERFRVDGDPGAPAGESIERIRGRVCATTP